MPVSIELVRKIDILEPSLRDVLYTFMMELEKNREESVSKKEFKELRDIVKELAVSQKELAEAQKRTEIKVEELAEAQKRTEIKVEELAEAQKRTEIKVEELVEAQKRTEKNLEELKDIVKELAEAQKRTELRMTELVEFQKKTEIRLDKVEENLGGISHSIGFSLENVAYKSLPVLLKRDLNIEVEGRLLRKFIICSDGREEQVDIYGECIRDGKRMYIIGEGKSQIGQKDMEKFLKKLKRLGAELDCEVVPLMISHIVTPRVERLLKQNNITFYLSYDF